MHTVVHTGVFDDLGQAEVRPGLGIGGAVHEPFDPGLNQCPGTHGTRLDRYVEGAPDKAPVSQDSAGSTDGQDLRVGSAVGLRFPEVVRPGDDDALVHNHSADGHLALGCCQPGLGQGFRHELLVLGGGSSLDLGHDITPDVTGAPGATRWRNTTLNGAAGRVKWLRLGRSLISQSLKAGHIRGVGLAPAFLRLQHVDGSIGWWRGAFGLTASV